jgi:hypothetical protein
LGIALSFPDKKIDAYINKQQSPQKEICQQLRTLIHTTLPQANEEMKWGVPAVGGGKFYIVALKDHLNLGFALTCLSETELKLFDGHAKTMAHIEITQTTGINEQRITGLLRLVESKK